MPKGGTMDKNKLFVSIASILTTLEETNGEAIASMIYLALGSNISDYDYVIGFGKHVGWLTATSTHVTITEAGRAKAKQISAILS